MTLAVVDQAVDDPFGQAKQGHAGDRPHQETVDAGMGPKPPYPGQGGITAWTFLYRHPVTLQPEIAKAMSHDKHQQNVQRSPLMGWVQEHGGDRSAHPEWLGTI